MANSKSSVNKGIQATNVTADVLAVGDRAQAVKNVTQVGNEELLTAIAEFKTAIGTLNLNKTAQAVVKEDLDKLENAAHKEKVDKEEIGGIMQAISGKLKMVGVIMNNTSNLIEPAKKIASFLGTTLKLISVF